MIRDDIKAALTGAMKSGDKARVGALRLAQAAIKNRDIELRGGGDAGGDDDSLVADVLRRMVKQRRESIELYRKGGRGELAEAESAEVAVLEEFLPRQMDEAATKAAVEVAVAEAGATSIRDMGRVMALLRDRHAGRLDMGRAGALLKARLSA